MVLSCRGSFTLFRVIKSFFSNSKTYERNVARAKSCFSRLFVVVFSANVQSFYNGSSFFYLFIYLFFFFFFEP